MSADSGDWLEGASAEAREDNLAKAVEFARNYEIFVNDPRGRELLAHWDLTLRRKITPTESSIQRYAADNAVREFINGIYEQIRLAQTNGKSA